MNKAREACIHHWMVESPNGTTSKGTCKKCGTAKNFFNTSEDMREAGTPWKRENKWTMKQRQIKLAKVSGSKGSI